MSAQRAIELLTEDEAAQVLRLCVRTLRKARQDGRLPYVLIGRAIRYTHADLETFISQARQDNPRPVKQPPAPRRSVRKPNGVIVPFSARQ